MFQYWIICQLLNMYVFQFLCGSMIVIMNQFIISYTIIMGNRTRVVGMATGYELDDRGIVVRVLEVKNFLFSNNPDRLWGPPTSYPLCAGGSFPGSKADWT
jgi:hypothetical protein